MWFTVPRVARVGCRFHQRDRGAVTVEGAVALCSLVLVFGAALSGVAAATDHMRCADAASEAARMLSRGDRVQAEEAVRRLAPDGAELDVERRGRDIAVTVRAGAAGGLLPGVDVRAEAHAEAEPGMQGMGDAGR
ncbi:hypothetical protein SacmaDRAFT_5013 [Saccharomonospora marina XMU15]|uniref:TadE-like protein n=1 Tax=Saccharomonospora marina XMU15 TaxID=882083 RepID=H5X253_9PSEU|nr:TadE family type IV pilus minor pilin [Saccharomonospora marina]EHR53182.1 hypothetical protein SacmaDRAFT_5013 [Saccharomonospora marina XMU15]